MCVTLKGIGYRAIRHGGYFRQCERELLCNERLGEGGLRQYQLLKLRQLLVHAYTNVPFYRREFDRLKFRPAELESLDEMESLPIIDKHVLRNGLEQFVSVNTKRRHLYRGSTSGSTGTPLTLFMDRRLIQAEHSFVWRQFRWAGCPSGGKVALFRGDMIVPAEQAKPPYWRHDVVNKELWCSSYHISETSIGSYLKALEDFEPHLIYAYPSSLFAIVQYATKQQREIALPHLRGIVTSSETLSSWQRESIEEYFKVRVFDWYGLFERVIFIGTCEFGSYHVFPDYGYTEFLPIRDGGRGNEYELVGTSFINSVVPLVRYRTGDIVRIEGDMSGQCECGRVFPCVDSILGRRDDAIVTPTGRVIGRLDHIFKTATNITFAQIIQESENELTIMVVPGEHYSDADREKLCTNARRLVGETMKICVETADHIPQESSGKFRGVISKMPQAACRLNAHANLE